MGDDDSMDGESILGTPLSIDGDDALVPELEVDGQIAFAEKALPRKKRRRRLVEVGRWTIVCTVVHENGWWSHKFDTIGASAEDQGVKYVGVALGSREDVAFNRLEDRQRDAA